MLRRLLKSRWVGTTFPKALVAYSALVLLGLLGIGMWFYHSQHLSVQHDVRTYLETIARLKVDQIVQWRKERMGDASLMTESPFFQEAVEKWRARPDPEITKDLVTRLRLTGTYQHYQNVMIVDSNGVILLDLTRERRPFHPAVMSALARAIRYQKVQLSELYAGPGDLPPFLDVIAPLKPHRSGESNSWGAVILRCDATDILYQSVYSWPVSNRSAEAMLVRREGNSALFLSPLLHTNRTSEWYIGLTVVSEPAAGQPLDHEGFFEGRDHRGVQAVSVAKAIPGSSWFLVAKMDTSEAYAPWRFRSATILIGIVALMIEFTLVAGFVWWHKARFQRYARSLIEASLDPMAAISPEGKITDVNAATEIATGVRRQELIGTDFSSYFSDPAKARAGYQQAFRDGSVRDFPLELRRGDGRLAPVLYNASVYKDDLNKVVGVFAAARDVSRLKEAEDALKTERQRILDVLETLPAMICLLTRDYRIAFANRSFRDRFGEANGRRCYEHCYGQTAPCSFCEAFTVLETHQPHHWELNTPEGRVLDVYDLPFTDPDGTPMVLEMNIDITERKHAEEAVTRSNAESLRFNQLAIGRELRMVELKQEINQLSIQLGRTAPFSPDLLREDFASPGRSETVPPTPAGAGAKTSRSSQANK